MLGLDRPPKNNLILSAVSHKKAGAWRSGWRQDQKGARTLYFTVLQKIADRQEKSKGGTRRNGRAIRPNSTTRGNISCINQGAQRPTRNTHTHKHTHNKRNTRQTQACTSQTTNRAEMKWHDPVHNPVFTKELREKNGKPVNFCGKRGVKTRRAHLGGKRCVQTQKRSKAHVGLPLFTNLRTFTLGLERNKTARCCTTKLASAKNA